MLEVSNTTGFPAACIPHLDVDGRDLLAVVVKGSFRIRPGSPTPDPADEQAPIVWADEFYGEPGVSSIRFESDTAPPKPGGDVVLIGHAYPGRAKVAVSEVTLDVGRLRKTVRVFGDRRWEKSLGRWKASPPEPFDRIPLVYERAFGGRDETDPDPKKHAYEQRNPVGTGFAATGSRERLDGLALPNLEGPDAPVKSWKDRPEPAGFGFVGRDWMPRTELAGTYDDKWQSDRCPLLPTDFDPRFFNSGPAGLVAPKPFAGSEQVRVTGAHRRGDLQFRLPALHLAVTAWIKGSARRATAALDTVVIEPDEERLLLVWRAAIPCSREFLHISNVFIKEAD
jgi:hypothetical protein